MTKKEVLDWLYRIKSKLTMYFPIKWVSECEQAIDYAIELLEKQKTGHWIRITNGAIKEKYICSECGRQIEDCGIENLLSVKYPYCHCGAKMEGK